MEWFENLFMDQVNDEKKKQVRAYVTSALNDQSLSRVMNLVVDFLLHKIIEYVS